MQEEIALKSILKQEVCIYCGEPLWHDKQAEDELCHGYDSQHVGTVFGYVSFQTEPSVAICQTCGWWKYTYVLHMSGFDDCFAGGFGVLRQFDLTDVKQPIDSIRSYLLAKYDARFAIHPRKFEELVASVFRDLGYHSRVTAYSGDDGIDVVLDGPNGDVVGVQVKRYSNSIEVDQIRALTGALVIGGYVLPQLKMEFVSGRLDDSLTGDSPHEFQPSSLHT
jgi:hypothetical protein